MKPFKAPVHAYNQPPRTYPGTKPAVPGFKGRTLTELKYLEELGAMTCEQAVDTLLLMAGGRDWAAEMNPEFGDWLNGHDDGPGITYV